MRVCITGHNGFIGKGLITFLSEKGISVISAEGRELSSSQRSPEFFEESQTRLESISDWSFLGGSFAVVHCAAISSISRNCSDAEASSLWKSNVVGTEKLANAVKEFKVSKFIFLSSAKVYGEYSESGEMFSESSPINSKNLYAKSKWAAEQMLQQTFEGSATELVILRLPMVYGCKPKNNIRLLCRIIKLGIPLPFAGVNNQRSMLSIKNLADLALIILKSENLTGCFNVSEPPISTTRLIVLLSKGVNIRPRLFPAPIWSFRLVGQFLRRDDELSKLVDSFVIDSRLISETLGWRPPHPAETELPRVGSSCD